MGIDVTFHSLLFGLAVLFTFICYRINKQAIVSSYFYIYYFLFAMASSIVIEGGAYMLEIERYGSPNGASIMIFCFFVAGLFFMVLGYSAHGLIFRYPVFNVRYSLRLEIMVSYFFLLFSFGLAIFIFLRYSSPLLLGVERFEFWERIVSPGLSVAKSLITQAFFFVPILLVVARKRLTFAVAAIAWALITVLVLGEKFTAFQYYLTIGGLFVAALFQQGRIKRLPVISFIVVAICLMILVAFVYEKSGYSFSFIKDRVALQSQLTWLVLQDNVVLDGFNGASSELDQIALSTERYNNYAALGIGLTGYNPAVLLSVFGWVLAFLMHCAVCFFLGFAQSEVVKLISFGAVIHGFVVFKLYIALLYFWMTANPEHLFGVVNILCFAILFVGLFIKLSLRATPDVGSRITR